MTTLISLAQLSSQPAGTYSVAFTATWGCPGCEGFAEQVMADQLAEFVIDLHKEDATLIENYRSLLPPKIPMITPVTIA
jgi:hypothetical protein